MREGVNSTWPEHLKEMDCHRLDQERAKTTHGQKTIWGLIQGGEGCNRVVSGKGRKGRKKL